MRERDTLKAVHNNVIWYVCHLQHRHVSMRHYALPCANYFPCPIIFTSSLPEIESSFSIMEKQIDIRKPKAILNYKVGEQK